MQLSSMAKALVWNITCKLFNKILGTIDRYHSIPVSVAFMLAEGHKVSELQNL